MKLLVSTSRSFSLFDVDSDEIQHINQGAGEYYGISYDDNQIYLAARGPFDFQVGGSIMMFDYDLKFKERIICPDIYMRNMHQIVCMDDELWITCTYDNFIMILNTENLGLKALKPNPDHTGEEWNHFNSIHFDGKIIYLVANNLKIEGRNSEVWMMTLDKLLRNFKLPGRDAHNIWKENGKLMTLLGNCDHSEKFGAVVDVNGNIFIETDLFMRGCSIVDGRRFIGMTERASREDRPYSESYIMEYDENWNFVKEHHLGRLGSVHDVRTPGYKDLCHLQFLGKKI